MKGVCILFNRSRYLRRLIDGMHNGQIKVITGLRRCGKSFLLFKLFNDYLRGIGVPDERIIKVSLDQDVNAEYRNPDRLSGFLRGKLVNRVKRRKINPKTIGTYLGYLTDSFLFRNVLRYDVKGRRYFEYPSKYYCEDVGLRNVMLNMRQIEPARAVENIIFNELIARGCSVDVGVVPFTRTDASGNRHQERCEIDFVVNQGRRRLYIQSAFNMDDPEKRSRKIRPFLAAPDGFQRIVVTNSPVKSWEDDKGIRYCNVQDFLLDEDIMR
ncbi:MAG: AAA family ATPase [Victivallaceae bacterium]|nr:AAA family ATPase [Victivallaceae bacterium]